jgi:hypothetical protein
MHVFQIRLHHFLPSNILKHLSAVFITITIKIRHQIRQYLPPWINPCLFPPKYYSSIHNHATKRKIGLSLEPKEGLEMEPCLPDIYVPSTEAQLEEAKSGPLIHPIVQMQE